MGATVTINESRSAPGVVIQAEPLTIEIPDDAGADPAAAILLGIQQGIREISQMSKNGKHASFNNSGRLVRELAVIAGADGSYDIVAPEGYLQDDALFQKLIDLVPAIQDPTTIAALQAAVERVASEMVRVG